MGPGGRWLPVVGALLAFEILALGAAAIVVEPPLVATLRNAAFDGYQRRWPRLYAEAPVRIVDVDGESLARLGPWPWPRTRLAELVNRLHALRADPDEAFAAAMERNGNVVLGPALAESAGASVRAAGPCGVRGRGRDGVPRSPPGCGAAARVPGACRPRGGFDQLRRGNRRCGAAGAAALSSRATASPEPRRRGVARGRWGEEHRCAGRAGRWWPARSSRICACDGCATR